VASNVTYDVWLMTGLKDNRRIATKPTLHEAYEVITPEERKEYVYILKWTPAREVLQEVDTRGRFGALQGQHRASKTAQAPTCKYIWGCICDREHTNDLRQSVRKVLRSN
jgi:hypothetical protein